MSRPFKPLILSVGDPAGIGPEITVKAWQALRTENRHAFAVIAPPAVFERLTTDIKIIASPAEAHAVFANALPILPLDGDAAVPGQPDSAHAQTITQSIKEAVALCLSGQTAGLVTNPIAKDVLYEAGFSHPGHTEYLGHLTETAPYDGTRGPVMMLTGADLRVALATVHMSLADAARSVTRDGLIRNARIMHEALQRDFGIATPRIAMAGLNPHAGEGGALGTEEQTLLNPVAETLRSEGIQISDARPADTLFHAEARQGYDAVLAMYHDQGLIPVKTLDFHGGVNLTLGLPIVRTSPDHGTAFDIAGQGKARPDSLIAAIRAARSVADHREASDV